LLHADFTAISSVQPELLPIEVLHCVNREFRVCFCYCDLNFDPMIFVDEHDPYSLNMYLQTKNEL